MTGIRVGVMILAEFSWREAPWLEGVAGQAVRPRLE